MHTAVCGVNHCRGTAASGRRARGRARRAGSARYGTTRGRPGSRRAPRPLRCLPRSSSRSLTQTYRSKGWLPVPARADSGWVATSPRQKTSSSRRSHRAASRTRVLSGPTLARTWPMTCAPPIGTITTCSAWSSPPRATAAVSTAIWSLVPSTSTRPWRRRPLEGPGWSPGSRRQDHSRSHQALCVRAHRGRFGRWP